MAHFVAKLAPFINIKVAKNCLCKLLPNLANFIGTKDAKIGF